MDEYGHTALMCLCDCNPRLLGQEWAMELAERQAGKMTWMRETALMMLFGSGRAEEVDFDSERFRLLFEREKGITNKDGRTALMCMC